MTISNSYNSYADCVEAMDRALADDKGVRIRMKDRNAATFFRMRLHQCRKLSRDRSKDIYDHADPLWGSSVYDPLVVRIREEGEVTYVYINQIVAELGKIEDLSKIGDWEALPSPEPAPALEPPRPVLQIEHFKRRV